MESSNLQDENIIKDIRNLFRLKKNKNYTAVKDIRNIFRQKKLLRIVLSMKKKKKIVINQ